MFLNFCGNPEFLKCCLLKSFAACNWLRQGLILAYRQTVWTKIRLLLENKMLVFRVGIHKMVVRIAKREDLDQSASSEAVVVRIAKREDLDQSASSEAV